MSARAGVLGDKAAPRAKEATVMAAKSSPAAQEADRPPCSRAQHMRVHARPRRQLTPAYERSEHDWTSVSPDIGTDRSLYWQYKTGQSRSH